jgi:hypothetical protein
MGAVDVLTQIEIARPPAEVAAFAAEPDNAPRWYVNIKSAEWRSDRALRVGARVAFVARLVMHTAEGPFPMETSYTWAAAPAGGTLMTLRNRGTPSGFSRLAAPFMAWAMRRANRADLARLKALMER